MYIPVMAFVTYILLSAILAGLRGSFKPELLGSVTSTAFAVVLFEIVVLKIAMYILNISNDSQLLDLIAYSGYKFVGIIVTLAVSEILSGGRGTTGWIGWVVFLYTFLANAFFLVSQPFSFSVSIFDVYKLALPSPLSYSFFHVPFPEYTAAYQLNQTNRGKRGG